MARTGDRAVVPAADRPTPHRRLRIAVPVAAFAGTWLSHTFVYLRDGTHNDLVHHLFGSVHAYMLPLGLVLFALSAAGGFRWWQAWRDLVDRLVRVGADGDSAPWRAAAPATVDSSTTDAGRAPFSRLAGLLFALQIVFYTVQENVEGRIMTGHLPGLSIFTGAHWPVLVIHLAVAVVIASLIGGARHRAGALARAVVARESLAHWLAAARRRLGAMPRPVLTTARRTPLALWGRQRWQRPPPPGLVISTT